MNYPDDIFQYKEPEEQTTYYNHNKHERELIRSSLFTEVMEMRTLVWHDTYASRSLSYEQGVEALQDNCDFVQELVRQVRYGEPQQYLREQVAEWIRQEIRSITEEFTTPPVGYEWRDLL